jgi:predicted Zn-dependent peptidase
MIDILNPIRTEAPVFGKVSDIPLVEPKKTKLDNGIDVFCFPHDAEGLVRLDLTFDAGRMRQNKVLVASTTGNLLLEGTSKHTSAQIADQIDFLGSYIKTDVDTDDATITIYSLTRNLSQTLAIVYEVLTDAIFPEEELSTYVQIHKQKLTVNNEKVDYIARREFSELMFGKNHPDGRQTIHRDYDNLNRQDMIEFYQQYYHAGNCTLFVSGDINASTLGIINEHLGSKDWKKERLESENNYSITPAAYHQHYINKENALQSAIRIGKPLFNKTHPDFPKLVVLNTIYGGYFGSRLMSNIREDKGYTYGIHSQIISQKGHGYFYISTEVGTAVCDAAVKEIYAEIKRLKQTLVPEEELQLVKNYMLGTFLRSMDGAFAQAERYKGNWKYGLDNNYFRNYIATIQNITTVELQALTNEYLNEDEMIELIVGGKN